MIVGVLILALAGSWLTSGAGVEAVAIDPTAYRVPQDVIERLDSLSITDGPPKAIPESVAIELALAQYQPEDDDVGH